MATTDGLVQQLKWNPPLGAVLAWIGPALENTQLFFIPFRASDSRADRAIKRSMAYGLTLAQIRRVSVRITHETADFEILTASIPPPFMVGILDQPIHQDFFTVIGGRIPDDVVMTFMSAGGVSAQVTPDLVRPSFAFVALLPTTVPLGPGTLRVSSPGTGLVSFPIAVDVIAGPPRTVRVLQPGAPKPNPFTFVIAANPVLTTFETGAVAADPVVQDRPGFHNIVLYCLRNWLTLAEDAFRVSNNDSNFRFVTIFDNSLPVSDFLSLATTYLPNFIGPNRAAVTAFANRYGYAADLFFTITGDPLYTRATAIPCLDDNARGGVTFTYDNRAHTHCFFVIQPGCAAIPLAVDVSTPTAVHELGHAVSDALNGRIIDLYSDAAPDDFLVNKKFRAAATDPVPVNFANYNGVQYRSDPMRDSLGYPSTWSSYHPELMVPTRPNLMDNYYYSTPTTACRFDRLTYRFIIERLAAKFSR